MVELTNSAEKKCEILELPQMIIADMGRFPYPLDVMSVFVLQVASVDGGHVKDLLSLTLAPLGVFPLFSPSHICFTLSCSFSIC